MSGRSLERFFSGDSGECKSDATQGEFWACLYVWVHIVEF